MLRWIALSAVVCVVCGAVGLGKIVPMASAIENVFLVMAALSATVLVSSTDAYETEAAQSDD